MKSTGRLCLVVLAMLALGASPQPKAARAHRAHPLRPAFVDLTRFDRFAPNAVRRARLAFLMPKHLSAAAKALATRNSTAAAATYTVIDLNALIKSSGYTYFAPLALNDDGRIVGQADGLDDGLPCGYIINYHGSNGALVCPPEEIDSNEYDSYFPIAISNKGGTVAGFDDGYFEVMGSRYYYYVDSELWTLTGAVSSTLVDQGGDEDTGDGFHTLDIANQNITVGGPFYNGRTYFHVANCPIADFYATAITDSGVIVGYSQRNRATVMTVGGCPTYVPNAPIGFIADAVAQTGDMILQNGSEYDLWEKGSLHTIPLPSGYDASKYFVDAIAVNASDVVVGNVVDSTNTPVAAFEYANGKSINVQSLFPPKSGWVATAVTGINDNGEIIGEGYFDSNETPFALRH